MGWSEVVVGRGGVGVGWGGQAPPTQRTNSASELRVESMSPTVMAVDGHSSQVYS